MDAKSPAHKPLITAISSRQNFIDRAQLLAEEFKAETKSYHSADAFSEDETQAKKSRFILLDAVESPTPQSTAGMVQVAKYVSPEAQIVTVVEKKVTSDAASFIKKSGASSVILEDEYFLQSKIEFVFAQKNHGAFVPIKAAELVPGKPVEMTLFHLMPLNQKFLPFLSKGQNLDESRYQKLLAVGEFYIRRDEIQDYQKYIELNKDLSAAGLKSRCRAQFLNMSITYKDLVQLIADQSEGASFKEGKELYEKAVKLAQDLITNLSATGEAWDVVNNSSMDDLSAIDRAPAIAAYAGLMSLMSGIGKPEDIMICALIADIGLLELHPKAIEKIRQSGESSLEKTESEVYRRHPSTSINMALSRKIPIPEKLKVTIQGTHERADGKGFPNGWPADKLSLESQLILYSEMLDKASLVEFGKERISPQQARQKLFQDQLTKTGQIFNAEFLDKIRQLVW